jgi:hypothetical protein
MKIRSAVDAYDRIQEPYVVAYLDVLGITARIKGSREKQTDALNVLHNLYSYIFELSDAERGIKKYSDIKFKVFSDNIIIAKKLSANRTEDVVTLLNCVSNFLCAAVGDGVSWLVRGGITLGDFYIDDTIVWGPALLRAYELEDKIANYPRVLLDTSVVNLLEKSKQGTEYIRVDFDGMPFLNYMSIWHFAGEIVSAAFEKMKVEARLPDGTYPEKVHQKLSWHMRYVNSELDRKNEKKDRKNSLTM